MKNLFTRKDIDQATIKVLFNPETAFGFKNIRDEYYTGYDNGMTTDVEINEDNYYVSARSLITAAFSDSSQFKVNPEFFDSINGNAGKYGLLFDVIFASGGLHHVNDRSTELLGRLLADYHGNKFINLTLQDEPVMREEDSADYVFKIYYNNCVRTLRIYSIPKQGYIDVLI